MGVLSSTNHKTPSNKTTKGFYFGAAEAEGENKAGAQNFLNFFEDYLGVLSELENEKFIFTGRKGVGKSALAKYIKDKSDSTSDSFCDLIKYNDLGIEKLIQLESISTGENPMSLVFEWLILVRLIKLIINSNLDTYSAEYGKLKKFIDRNSGMIAIDKFEITQIISQGKFEINFEVLNGLLPLSFGKDYKKTGCKAPFYKLINPLKDTVKKILSCHCYENIEFWLIFDDLDIGFNANDPEHIKTITELIRVARSYNTDVFRNTKAKVLLFLRDDLQKTIDSHNTDTAKMFSSYGVNINWYSEHTQAIDENNLPIKKFINKRIQQNFIANGITKISRENPWKDLIEEPDYESTTMFRKILDYTYFRPRDFILFLSPISKEDYTYPLKKAIIQRLLKSYANANISEMTNELKVHFSSQEIGNIKTILSKISKKRYSYEELEALIDTYGFELSSHDVITILVSYSILVLTNPNDEPLYSYRYINTFEIHDIENYGFSLHKLIYLYYNPTANLDL